MPIKQSELVLNPDGSVYHLNLRPEHIANTIIFVGDQNRVEKITQHFDCIEHRIQNREFKTQTGYYNGKRLTVISTGIGADNIDIVINELDALVNINLKTRHPKAQLTSLTIIRIGTSGALQEDIPVDTYVLSALAIDTTGMLHFYDLNGITHPHIEDQLIAHTGWSTNKARPTVISNSKHLQDVFDDAKFIKGITMTAGGFYGPQGRVLRAPLQAPNLNKKLRLFVYDNLKVTNFEMETSAIYGLSKLLGHKALSLNAILANRTKGTFSKHPSKTINNLITTALERISTL